MTGTLDTDKLFTGQRLDQTGLYFYNSRYYDATIEFVNLSKCKPLNAKFRRQKARKTYLFTNSEADSLAGSDPEGSRYEAFWG